MEDNKPQGQPAAQVDAAQQAAPAAANQAPQQDERMVQIARKERMLHQQRRQFEQERKAFEAQRQAPAKVEQPTDWKNKFLQDPESVGLSYDDLANLVVNRGNPQDTALRKMQIELERVKAEQEQGLKRIQESQDAAYKTALNQVKRDVARLVETDESFETIKASKSEEAVVDLIEQTFKEDGILMSVEEAAKEVEDYLLEQALMLAGLKKVKAKLAPPIPVSPELQSPASPAAKPKSPSITTTTLTNRIEQPSAKSSSWPEKRAALIAKLSGKQS